MELGLTPWDFSNRSAARLAAQARLAEELGYGSFWLPENHFNPGAIPDPLMLLAAAAASTSRIRLATTSYLLTLRNPLQAAEQVAVLDQLCEGRVLLGVGRGYAPTMLKAFNVDPREKRTLFETRLALMRRAWAGEEVALGDGEDQETIVLDPLPVQRPHPPLWVAAFGPKALAQAGRLGLPYLASPVETLGVLADNYATHAEASRDAGLVAQETVPIMRTVFVSASAREARSLRERLQQESAKSGRRPGALEPAAVEDWCIIGEASFVRDRIAEYRERLKVTHLIVTRPRVGGVAEPALRASLETIPELIPDRRAHA